MSKARAQYSVEFKREAVALVTQKNHTPTEAARILKVNDSMLRRWVKEFQDNNEQAFPGKGHQTAELEELARLKRENKRLTTEVDILKKAAAYFAKDVL